MNDQGRWIYAGWPGNTNMVACGDDRPYTASIGDGQHGDAIAVAYGSSTDEADANARLIASAPELLAACRSIVSLEGSPTMGGAMLDAVREQARAAIAKAEGAACD